jgi:hypothetical protein
MTTDTTWLDDALKRAADGGVTNHLLRVSLGNLRLGEWAALASSLHLLSGSGRFTEQEIDALQAAAAVLRSKETT